MWNIADLLKSSETHNIQALIQFKTFSVNTDYIKPKSVLCVHGSQRQQRFTCSLKE